MKSLYSEDGLHFTDEANKLTHETIQAVESIAKRWVAQGYSVREVSHVMLGAVMENELYLVLETRCPKQADLTREAMDKS